MQVRQSCSKVPSLKAMLWVLAEFFNEKFQLIDWHWSVWWVGGRGPQLG